MARAAREAWAVVLAVAASRVPFLSAASYGADPDAWRIAASGAVIAETGAYAASRPPGYPLVEGLAALLHAAGGGPLAWGALTALASGAACGAFVVLLHALGSSRGAAALGGLALGAVPALFVASTGAMETAWALAAGLGALASAARGRPVVAGVLLGVAVGCRPTSALLGLAALGLLWSAAPAARRVREGAAFAGAALATGLGAFAPPLLAHGLGAAQFFDGRVPLALAVHRATVGVWGVLGSAAVGVAAVAAVGRALGGRGGAVRRRPGAWAGIGASAAAFGLLYARLPLEAGYLVPAAALVLALLAMALPPRGVALVAVWLVASPFALSLEAPAALAPGSTVLVRLGPAALAAEGPALQSARLRRADVARGRRLTAEALAAAPGSPLVLGPDLPRVVVLALRENGRLPRARLRYGDAPAPAPPLRTADERIAEGELGAP